MYQLNREKKEDRKCMTKVSTTYYHPKNPRDQRLITELKLCFNFHFDTLFRGSTDPLQFSILHLLNF